MRNQLFSVIIATYNAERTIEKCLTYLERQTCKDFELIVIDGASSDDTVSAVRKHTHLITKSLNEPDTGLYDAWNKGLKYAHGEWILFIGADDYLLPDALETYKSFLTTHDTGNCYFISSKVELIDEGGNGKRVFGWPWDWNIFRRAHIVAHPGSLHRRSLFENYGVYDTRFKIAGDYELLLRPKQKLNALFVNRVTVQMTEGGVSTTLRTCSETRQAKLKNKARETLQINTDFLWQVLKFVGKKTFSFFGLHLFLLKEHQD